MWTHPELESPVTVDTQTHKSFKMIPLQILPYVMCNFVGIPITPPRDRLSARDSTRHRMGIWTFLTDDLLGRPTASESPSEAPLSRRSAATVSADKLQKGERKEGKEEEE